MHQANASSGATRLRCKKTRARCIAVHCVGVSATERNCSVGVSLFVRFGAGEGKRATSTKIYQFTLIMAGAKVNVYSIYSSSFRHIIFFLSFILTHDLDYLKWLYNALRCVFFSRLCKQTAFCSVTVCTEERYASSHELCVCAVLCSHFQKEAHKTLFRRKPTTYKKNAPDVRNRLINAPTKYYYTLTHSQTNSISNYIPPTSDSFPLAFLQTTFCTKFVEEP